VNKQELIEVVAKKVGHSKRFTGQVVNTVMEVITEELAKGQKVVFAGFGTFATSKKAARMGVNPQTLAKIKIPATTVPKFRAGKTLKLAVKK